MSVPKVQSSSEHGDVGHTKPTGAISQVLLLDLAMVDRRDEYEEMTFQIDN